MLCCKSYRIYVKRFQLVPFRIGTTGGSEYNVMLPVWVLFDFFFFIIISFTRQFFSPFLRQLFLLFSCVLFFSFSFSFPFLFFFQMFNVISLLSFAFWVFSFWPWSKMCLNLIVLCGAHCWKSTWFSFIENMSARNSLRTLTGTGTGTSTSTGQSWPFSRFHKFQKRFLFVVVVASTLD